MNHYLLYGKMTRNLYSIIRGDWADVLAMGENLQRRYPREEFYALQEDPQGFAFQLSAEELEDVLSKAIRVGQVSS